MEAAERQRKAREMLAAQPLAIEAAKPKAKAFVAKFSQPPPSVQSESKVLSDVALDTMGTEYLRQQATQLAKLRADEKELHRAVTFQRCARGIVLAFSGDGPLRPYGLITANVVSTEVYRVSTRAPARHTARPKAATQRMNTPMDGSTIDVK
jgi:hypothetical protein